MFKWTIHLVVIEGIDDLIKCKNKLKSIAKPKNESYSEAVDLCIEEVSNGLINGGLFISNEQSLTGVIIVYPSSSKLDIVNTICHEKRHAEDTILESLGIDDRETAGYISGYLGHKLLKHIL